jgi:SNF2 family DNA or RNA helicase
MTAPTPPPAHKLWAHQEHALQFVQNLWDQGYGGILLNIVMGGGKSLVAIEAAVRNRLSPILIVCPLRVVEVWREQFDKHLPDQYDFLALDGRAGTVSDKARAARDRLAWNTAKRRPLVICINYESARLEPFASWSLANLFPLVIGDELHRAKSPSGAISRYMGKLGLRAERRLGLTGTPIPHSPLDIWGQFRFLDRDIYDPTYFSFKQRYAILGGYQGKVPVGWRDMEDWRERFFSRSFQVGPEVLDLPPERDQTLHCALSPSGARIYAQMENDLIAWVGSAPAPVIAANAMVRLLRLQQITSGSVTDVNGQEQRVDYSKQQMLADLLEDLPEAEPVVIFCRFRSDLARVRLVAAELGRASGELSGSHDDLAAWKRGRKNDPVILAVQIQAGGVGIDLTRAAYAIYYSVGFNLGDYLQSRARIYRNGQTRPVLFYHLAAQNTVDGIVIRALTRRQDLIKAVLEEFKCRSKT